MTPSRSASSARNISVIPWKNKNLSEIQEGQEEECTIKIFPKSDVSKSDMKQLHARFLIVHKHHAIICYVYTYYVR